MSKIKRAELDDIPAIASIFEQMRRAEGIWVDKKRAKEFIEERMKKKESVIFIAYHGDYAVGLVQLYPLFSTVRMKKVWQIYDLYADPGFEEYHCEDDLIRAAKDFVREKMDGGIIAETKKSNLEGNELYLGFDFELEASNVYCWSNDED